MASGLISPAAATQLHAENFDQLESVLTTKVDEPNIPADLKGFTHIPPEGWSVDLAPAMPKGMTEWQGWSFTTLPFWTAADGQDRANFTRAKGVLAVADPDEWDDKDSPSAKGVFDSTLTSKPVALPSGLSQVHIGFASHYRQDGTQKAQVTVSFDGGAPTTILTLDADAENEYYSIPVAVPTGATSVKVAWRLYDAGNNWYWAVDDLKVSDQPIPIEPAPPLPGTGPVELPQGPNGTRTTKVLVFGMDGTRLDKVQAADAPNLKALMANGLTAPSMLYAQPMAATSSGPGWSTLTHGVWPDKHGVKDNSFTGKNYEKYPDFLTLMEKADPKISTFAAADWEPIASSLAGGPIISDKVDVRVGLEGDSKGYRLEDARIADAASRYLGQQNPDAAFVYFGEPDITAHEVGPDSPSYLATLNRVDGYIGQVLRAVRNRPTYAQEDWLILAGTDHGHKAGGGHGGNDPFERATFVLAQGKGIPAGTVRTDVKLVDLAATALKHLNVEADLDGRPLSTANTDAFDTLRPQLGERVDESGIPAGIKGFTHTPPAGWAVENNTSGGVAEWRGWSFTTDEFWTRAERGNQRESNVRSRDVFAVADSDEWADKPYTGTFDSTLVTPAYNVYAAGKLTLDYVSHYRQDRAQKGEVLISFDGGTPVLVRTHDKDGVAAREHVEVAVPQGAKQAQVRFRYVGDNDWFWAVDDVQVRSRPLKGLSVTGATTRSVQIGSGAGKVWQAYADVTVTDLEGKPVYGALVQGSWLKPTPGSADLPAACWTGNDGRCSLTVTAVGKDAVTVKLSGVRHASLTHYREGDTVTEVTVTK